MEIKKIENCDYVMFPRLQRKGLKLKHVEREAFRAELKHIEGHGDFWLLYQQSKPHLVAHVHYPRQNQSLTIFSAGVWVRTNGATILKAIYLSFV